MCDVCVATGRMTGAEWDQIQAAERDQDLGALLDIVGKIQEREKTKLAKREETILTDPRTPEDAREDEILDGVLRSLIEMAEEYDGLPLRKAHRAFALEILSVIKPEELAYGLAALATRLWRNAQ